LLHGKGDETSSRVTQPIKIYFNKKEKGVRAGNSFSEHRLLNFNYSEM